MAFVGEPCGGGTAHPCHTIGDYNGTVTKRQRAFYAEWCCLGVTAEGQREDIPFAMLFTEGREGAERVGKQAFDLLPFETTIANAEEFHRKKYAGIGGRDEWADHLVNQLDPRPLWHVGETASGDLS